ncbi:zona pellucida-binding protein 2 isoform X2 [Lagopus muta]|uniref:zona pellucida-binding protein 2 isoform X2 n=1 Tax=Lagopus muta TaxID=64668 RepID=UPI00209DD532|nr:zona pellucida-binding protein 2 isoform X2 [Lagopus muta]
MPVVLSSSSTAQGVPTPQNHSTQPHLIPIHATTPQMRREGGHRAAPCSPPVSGSIQGSQPRVPGLGPFHFEGMRAGSQRTVCGGAEEDPGGSHLRAAEPRGAALAPLPFPRGSPPGLPERTLHHFSGPQMEPERSGGARSAQSKAELQSPEAPRRIQPGATPDPPAHLISSPHHRSRSRRHKSVPLWGSTAALPFRNQHPANGEPFPKLRWAVRERRRNPRPSHARGKTRGARGRGDHSKHQRRRRGFHLSVFVLEQTRRCRQGIGCRGSPKEPPWSRFSPHAVNPFAPGWEDLCSRLPQDCEGTANHRAQQAKERIGEFFRKQTYALKHQFQTIPAIHYVEGSFSVTPIDSCRPGFGRNTVTHRSCAGCCVVCSPGTYSPDSAGSCRLCVRQRAARYGAKSCP